MNKKLLKKALTAVLSAALLLSGNGMTPLNASAAQKIYVEGVYTTFQKATMTIGSTKQITTYVEPSNATIQKMHFKSSNSKVAKVSNTGLVTAVAPGKATITVLALDGSSQTEQVTITVLKDLTLTKNNVDSDNEIIVIDQTYGNLIIDESVGDAVIYLAGVAVRNNLVLDSGDYTVNMYDSSAEQVIIEDTEAANEIVSFAVTEEEKKAPKLVVGSNTEITEIQAKINAMIKQENGSAIDGLTFTQDKEGKITVYLEGYSGNLLIDSSLGDLEVVTTGCQIGSASVSGGENAGNVKLTDAGNSSINNLNLDGAAKVELAVPTTQVGIDEKAKGSSLTTKASVGTITNSGAESKISVGGTVDTFESVGQKADISVEKGAAVVTINLSGEGSSLSGKGEVAEAYVNASNCKVDTENTLVTVGSGATGTKVLGNAVDAGKTTTSQPQAGGGAGGGPGGSDEEDNIIIAPGTVLVDNDFEDGTNDLIIGNGGGFANKVDNNGFEGGKALKVFSRGNFYDGMGYNFDNLLNKHVTVNIQADMKTDTGGTLKASIILKEGGTTSYPSVDSAEAVAPDTWVHLNGDLELANGVTSAMLYFESILNPDDSSGNVYWLDNVLITIKSVGEAVRVSSVALDKDNMELSIGGTDTLTATITPSTADNKNVTWTSSDSTVATVVNGVVTGKKAGDAVITVKTVDGNFTDTCSVHVNSDIALSLDHKLVVLSSINQTKTVTANVPGVTWLSNDTGVATVVDGVVTAKSTGSTTITAAVGTQTVTCEVIVDTNIVIDQDFETNLDNINRDTWASDTTLVTDATDAFNGKGYAKMKSIGNVWTGDEVILNNSAGATSAVFNITAFIKGIDAGLSVGFFDDNDADTVYNLGTAATTSSTEWKKINSGDVTVPAHATIYVRFRSEPMGTFLVDGLYVTKIMNTSDPGEEDPGEEDPGTGSKYFSDFNLSATPNSFSLVKSTATWDPADTSTSCDFYLNGTNFSSAASSSGISDAALLDKFNSWAGVKEVVKGFEFTITVNAGKALTGTNLIANTIIQNEVTAGSYNGSFIVTGYDMGVNEVSTPITITKQVLFDDITSWNANDALMVKAAVRFGNIDPATTITGTVNVKVLSKDKPVEPVITTLTNAASPTYGLTILASAVSGSAITVDSEDNAVIIDGDIIYDAGGSENYKVASIYLDDSYIGQTVSVTAKVRRSGTAGNLTWQMYDGSTKVFATQDGAAVDTWYTITDEAVVTYAGELYLSTYPTAEGTTYYLADVVIVAKKI